MLLCVFSFFCCFVNKCATLYYYFFIFFIFFSPYLASKSTLIYFFSKRKLHRRILEKLIYLKYNCFILYRETQHIGNSILDLIKKKKTKKKKKLLTVDKRLKKNFKNPKNSPILEKKKICLRSSKFLN